MKMTKYYVLLLLIAACFVWFSQGHWFLLIPSLWIFTAIASVTFAYTMNYPALFRKSVTGQIPWWIKLILLPYLVGAQLYNSFMRLHDSVPAIQQITPNLYLAARLFPSDIEALKAEGVTAILDVTSEFDGFNWSAQHEGLYYLNIPILDHFSPTEAQLQHAVRWISAQHKLKQKVVVHCALGRGRSFFMTCAYLLMSEPDLTVRDAIEKVQTVRTTARLNAKQMKSLLTLSKDMSERINPKLHLIVNPVSGSGKWQQHANQIVGQLTRQYELEFFFTEPETHVTDVVKSMQQQDQAMTFVACGGDGTVAEVATAVKNSQHRLAILPLGTANALAHVLFGVGTKIDPITQACDALFKHQEKRMDTMLCNQKTVLLVIAVGFEEQMIDQADRAQKDQLGQLAYIQGFINAVINNKAQDLKVRIDDGEQQDFSYCSLAVANAAPSTTVLAQGGGEPDWQDGLLDITQIEHDPSAVHRLLSLVELINNSLSNAISGEASPNYRVSHCQAKKIQLFSDAGFKYSIDGEIAQATQLDIEVLPASLRVIC
ncbi:dual specificity protein phosphatase family protein [Motilimonas cestriensis]|uniref:Dual specificity protein phosphatase family protein n=1 Tax=Motilimonas cestriensis TaxID=2742685 RepID=A0ABS8WFL5_9GAMM|nr:diacylglycerol kinase family protein [Motilimonas cestriensis]MCE2596135.1 dual specificity protein phosphatase family protein [Motilimonas cestriensis]